MQIYKVIGHKMHPFDRRQHEVLAARQVERLSTRPGWTGELMSTAYRSVSTAFR